MLSVGKVGTSETAAFFGCSLKGFANNRREANGPELPWVCYAGEFMQMGLLLHGANHQGPGQFEGKG